MRIKKATALSAVSLKTMRTTALLTTVFFLAWGAGCKPKKSKSYSTAEEKAPKPPSGFVMWTMNINLKRNLPDGSSGENLQCWYYYENTLSWFKQTTAANMQQLFKEIVDINPKEILNVNQRPVPVGAIEETTLAFGEIVSEAYQAHIANKGKEVNPALMQNKLLLTAIEVADDRWAGDAGFACPPSENVAAALTASELSQKPEEFRMRFRSENTVLANGAPANESTSPKETSFSFVLVQMEMEEWTFFHPPKILAHLNFPFGVL